MRTSSGCKQLLQVVPATLIATFFGFTHYQNVSQCDRRSLMPVAAQRVWRNTLWALSQAMRFVHSKAQEKTKQCRNVPS